MARNLDTGEREDVVPLTSDLNGGYSWGLEHLVIFGWRGDRHTGEVKAFCTEEYPVQKFSEPKGYDKTYIDHDGVS